MSWLNNALIYQIFIDRFAGYDPQKDWQVPDFMGGNLRGIIEKFDYIKSLGVNTIWLSPFYKGTEFHGYHITDFFSVDERFGTEDDLRELIDLVHANDMKIIADFVPNHVGAEHAYFVDAQTNPDSPYRDWFTFKKWPDVYREFQTFHNLPKFNLNNPDALAYMQDAGRKWLAMGLDGYRVDHVIGLTNKNVADLFGVLKQEFADKVFFGEAALFGADGDPARSRSPFAGIKTLGIPHPYRLWLLKQYGLNPIIRNYVGLLDGMLDFYFTHQVIRLVNLQSPQAQARMLRHLQKRAEGFSDGFSLVYFLDNHDLTRFIYRANGDKKKLLTALEAMLSLKGAKVFYAGTEVGVSQEKPFKDMLEHGDIQARKPMPWGAMDDELLEEFKKLLAEAK